MDEHREEREELAQLERDDRDDARQTREEWAQNSGLEPYQVVMMESAAWSR